MNHFQKQGKISINYKKQQNPRKIAENMKKKTKRFLASGILSSVFDFLKSFVLLCVVHLKEKNNISENFSKWYMNMMLSLKMVKYTNRV